MPVPNKFQDFSSTPTRIVIFIFIALALIALMGIAISNRQTSNNQNNSPAQKPREIVTISPHTIVYGTWTTNSTALIAYDLSTGWEGVIANLPVNIKKVTVTSPSTLIYINGTDNKDHGKQIVQHNLLTQERSTIYEAENSFGIDDYVISPDNKRLAVWEVQMNEDSGVLINGRSRVYSSLIGESGKNLIYDEESTLSNPVRYPRAILNDGRIFSDRFLPNSGTGWAYGMSVSNFIGTEKQDIESMQNGTYGTQPVLSPDGKYLAFAGYDGSRGSGTIEINGFRRAIVSSNTVELLDVETLQRERISNLSSNNLYTDVSWNDNSDNLLISVNNRDPEQTGMFNYDLLTNTLRIDQDQTLVEDQMVLRHLTHDLWLVGTKNTSSTTLGNLGDTYDTPYNAFSIYNLQTHEISRLETVSDLMQLVSIIPSTSFGSFQLLLEETPPTNESLQIKSFNLKSNLAPVREAQQSDRISLGTNPNTDGNVITEDTSLPKCKDFSETQITQTCGTPPPTGAGNTEAWTSYQKCSGNIVRTNRSSGVCYDSPLYLYGPEGLNVKATIHTPIFDSNAKHSQNTYDITLGKNGTMYVSGSKYEGIEYNYTPAVRSIKRPTYGSVVKNNELKNTLNLYAQNLGLNTKETNDLLSSGEKAATGKYVFVSYFDHETSHAILPITFNPKPDVYRNIVFYFENLDSKPKFSFTQPKFEKIKRKGFTAIEISEIVK